MNPGAIFTGLYGYECVMLVCGFTLFVFALAAITVLIVQRRSFKAVSALFLIAIVLMGFPGIAAVKFNDGALEIEALRHQAPGSLTPQQQAEYTKTLASVAQRSAGLPQLQAKIADGYRVLGDTNRAYALAQSVLAQDPKPATRQLLVPVLTAKLNQAVAASTPAKAPGHAATGASTGAPAGPPASTATPATLARQREIATVATQLQKASAALPATSHVALAQAYVALGQPQQAQANVSAARRLDPGIHISPATLRATRTPPPVKEH